MQIKMTYATNNLTGKSIEQSTEINIVSLPDKSSSIVEDAEDAEKNKEETTFQRRLQFKFNENIRRRFF